MNERDYEADAARADRVSVRARSAVRSRARIRRIFGQGAHIAVADLASMYARTGRRMEAVELLQALWARARRQYIPPENIAAVYGALGQMDEAMRWLERAYDNRSTCRPSFPTCTLCSP